MALKSNIRRTAGETLFSDTVQKIAADIESFLSPADKIIDLGSGTCLFTKLFREKGYDVTPVDISNKSYYPAITPLVYDGKKLPFKDNEFDVCMLIAVLHHTPDPEVVLREAMRVAKKLVIMEDAITNVFQRYYSYLLDSILNKEFFGHPHTNKTDEQWQELFQKLGLTLVKREHKTAWLFLSNPMYYLTK